LILVENPQVSTVPKSPKLLLMNKEENSSQIPRKYLKFNFTRIKS
jgi:hypothetical protein